MSSSTPNPAEMYEAVLVQQLFKPLSHTVMESVPPQPGGRMLDVAAGTGIILRTACANGSSPGKMAAVDISPMMIQVGEARCREQGIEVDWYEASADELPLEDKSFDTVYCQQGLQFSPDKAKALAEMHRILVENGTMFCLTWRGMEHHPFIRDINTVARHHAGISMLDEPFSLSDENMLNDLATQSGFKDARVEMLSVTTSTDTPVLNARMMLMGATAAIRSLQSLTPEERTEMVDTIIANADPVFEQYTGNGEMVMDWHTNMLVARK
jgi:SAM-dependent methyltransferase